MIPLRRFAPALILMFVAPDLSHAYCQPETSPCYRWDRYPYNGGIYCRHWYYNALDNAYLIGLASGIGPSSFLTTVQGAHDRWEAVSTSALPDFSYTVNSPPDTATVSYWLWVDDATWAARGMNPNAGAITYQRVDGFGVIVHGRTWLHLKPSSWRWSPDCTSENCVGDAFTQPGLDFPTIATHEIGHWWKLLDISAAGCESVVMWYSISTNQVKRSPQFPDADGAVLLYEQPVEVLAATATVDAQPDHVSLTWRLDLRDVVVESVERSGDDESWTEVGKPIAEGEDQVAFLDSRVVPGRRYAYRLVLRKDGTDFTTEEALVDVPGWGLKLEVESPTQASPVRVQIELPSSGLAVLELLDVSGRRLAVHQVTGSERRAHTISWNLGDVRCGMYWVRLTQANHALTRTIALVR